MRRHRKDDLPSAGDIAGETMEHEEALEKSRTRLKREAEALQRIGERLAGLSDDQLARMPLTDDLLAAILDVKSMRSHGARRRQMQYIGSLMRKVDRVPIEQALMEIAQGAFDQARVFHRIENWRDRLVAGDDDLLDEIVATVDGIDRQRLGQLVRAARKESASDGAAKKSARHLFRFLKSLAEG